MQIQEKKNQIFELNWEEDLLLTSEPVGYLYSHQFSDKRIEDCRKFPLVQADPTDIICFTQKIGGKHEHRANKIIWMSTIDRYLWQYYLLARQKEEIEDNHIQLRKILIPYCVHEEYLDYLARRDKYPICYDIRFFEQLNEEIPEDVNFLFYNVPKFAGSSYLNYICRSIYTRKNADDDRYSLFSDGLKFKLRGIEDFIPPFELEDYFEHEMSTGVSLSVEIASVLLEFEDNALRDIAWNAFCERVLPRIIHSQLFFTRNTIARHFFQQLLMEKKIDDFRWYPEEPGLDINGMLNRALSHTELIWSEYEPLHYKFSEKNKTISVPRGNIYPPRIKVPEEQIDESLEHLWSLLSIVTQPFNLCYHGNNKTKEINESTHLAVFCNPNHKNVQKYLDDLSECVAMRDQVEDLGRGKKYPIPRKRDNAHTIFRMVHSAVRKMI